MYRFYRWIYDLMGFSRSQANGFLIFLPLLTLIVFSEPAYRFWLARHPPDHAADFKRLDSLVALWPTLPNDSIIEPLARSTNRQLDVNTATMTELLEIGLPKPLAGRIISYRSRGSKFRRHDDLKKIYGMDTTLLANISAHLTFPAYDKGKSIAVYRNVPVPKPAQRLDINLVDTAALKKVNGIGDKLSLRIIRYREALGGFVSLDQLGEIYRLDTSVVRRLKRIVFIEPGFSPAKVNINESSEKELSLHPYLSPKETGAIVAYRFKHGKFQSVADLANIRALDTTSIRRITPYLEFR